MICLTLLSGQTVFKVPTVSRLRRPRDLLERDDHAGHQEGDGASRFRCRTKVVALRPALHWVAARQQERQVRKCQLNRKKIET